MAQSRAANSTGRSGSSRSGGKTAARKSNSSRQNRSPSTTTRARAGSSRRRRSSRSGSRARQRRSSGAAARRSRRPSASRSNGAGRIESARKTATDATKSVGRTIGNTTSKAKLPALASGAAIAGLAGGVALGARGRSRRKLMGVPLPRRSVLKASTKNLASSAQNAARFGEQLAELTTEVKRTREAVQGGEKRSPVEVVLEGLTHRGR
jgi:hypothetical protein